MSLQRIVLLAIAAQAVTAGLAQPAAEPDGAAGSDCATVVVQLYRGLVNSIDVALPAGTDPQVAPRCIERIQQYSGWQFDTPIVNLRDGVGAKANAVGSHPVTFVDLSPIAAIVLAMDARDRVLITFLPVESTGDGEGSFENEFVRMQWRQLGGLRYYDVVVKDNSFESVADILSEDRRARARETRDTGGHLPLGLLLLASLLIGAVAYFVSRAVMLSRAEAGHGRKGR